MGLEKPPAFGAYTLSPRLQRLLRLAQNQPRSWLGRRCALMLRKIVLIFGKSGIIDAEVEGLKARFHLKDNVSERKFLFTPQFFDRAERDLIACELPENGIFVDIGANAGLYTLTASKHLGAGGLCLSIEPNPVMRARLEHNIAFNDFKNEIRILPYGVSDTKGSFKLYLDESNFGGASLIAARGKGGDAIEIECYPLMDILTRQNITRIDILKIDIEGAEDKALRPFFDIAPENLYPRHMIIENDKNQWDSGLIDRLVTKYSYELVATTRMNIILSRQ